MGIQDYIDRIDPVTGDKHVREGMNTPGRDKGPMFMCPHGGGGRNWSPTPDMGVLTTGGGLVFTGWMDRQFVAYDQKDGKELWRTGVTGVPNASAITYAVDGKQYVAMVTGAGNPLSSGIPDVIPETQMQSVNSSSVYVFALPDPAP